MKIDLLKLAKLQVDRDLQKSRVDEMARRLGGIERFKKEIRDKEESISLYEKEIEALKTWNGIDNILK